MPAEFFMPIMLLTGAKTGYQITVTCNYTFAREEQETHTSDIKICSIKNFVS
jgi:hypothetical protein